MMGARWLPADYAGALSSRENAAVWRSQSRLKEGTLRVQATNSTFSFEVATDDAGVVGHAARRCCESSPTGLG
jgi:hypothetical protein